MRSGSELALWLADLLRPGADPGRARAAENGQALLALATQEGELDELGESAPALFAAWLSDLYEDGWIRGHLDSLPGEESPSELRDVRSLPLLTRIRLTPEAWRAVPGLRGWPEARNPPEESPGASRDVFISHASEDKEAVARPLAVALQARGWQVWFDEYELTLGDGLRRTLDRGLATSRYGIVVLSPHFFAKEWPQRELDGLVARETVSGDKVVLPVWHGVDAAYVARFSPMLADKLAAPSTLGAAGLAEAVEKALLSGGLKRTASADSVQPAPSLAHPGAANPVLEAVMSQNPVMLREVLRRELAAYHAAIDELLDGRFPEHPTGEVAAEVGTAVVPIVERLATQLLPLIDHDVEQLESQLRTLARKLRRPAVNGYVFWHDVRMWATWWLVHVLGAYAVRRENFEAVRPILRTRVETEYSDVTISLAHNFLNDASTMIGNALAPGGQNWLSPAWEHLAASVRDSAGLRAGWPELFEEREDPRQALAEWSLIQTLGLGLLGEGSVGFWQLGTSAPLARRFARDEVLRARLAEEAFGMTRAELDAQAAGAFEAVRGWQMGFTSGAGADLIFLGRESH